MTSQVAWEMAAELHEPCDCGVSPLDRFRRLIEVGKANDL